MSNLATVQAIYQAVATQDMPGVLAQLAEDVQWESWDHGNSAQAAGIPTMQRRDGREAVAGFFLALSQLKHPQMEVRDMMASERQVGVDFLISFETPAGIRATDEEIHLWTFSDAGKVSRLRHYTDTAKHIAAWKQQG